MLRFLRDVARDTWNGFFENRLTSMAAAIAFYTIFSLGPILIIAVALAEPVVGHMAVEEAIIERLREVVGGESAEAFRRILERGLLQGATFWTTALGVAVLLYSGTAMFVELDSALDWIWRPRAGWKRHPVLAEIRSRLLALLLMASIGALLLVFMVSSVVVSGAVGALHGFPVVGEWLGPLIAGGWSAAITAVFFTLVYKFLPDAGVPWRIALVSGVAVALLFLVGNRAIVWYFGYTKLGSAFGAAGALAAVMVWIYYSAIIVLAAAQVGRAVRDALDARRAPAEPAG